jgi:hypothetical protein
MEPALSESDAFQAQFPNLNILNPVAFLEIVEDIDSIDTGR